MTQENTQHRYSITDILGAPCSEEEARRRIREETDLTTLNAVSYTHLTLPTIA